MRDRPILFTGVMIRSLLAGDKTQTRRLIKGEIPDEAKDAGVFSSPGRDYDGEWMWLDYTDIMWASPVGDSFRCPYGQDGDLLYVRETLERANGEALGYPADGTWLPNTDWRWRRPKLPAIHMPRWASRLTLAITDVRVQRLQDISEADAKAEGITFDKGIGMFRVPGTNDYCMTAAKAYQRLWALINGEESQAANPWTWALTFEVHHENVDAYRKTP